MLPLLAENVRYQIAATIHLPGPRFSVGNERVRKRSCYCSDGAVPPARLCLRWDMPCRIFARAPKQELWRPFAWCSGSRNSKVQDNNHTYIGTDINPAFFPGHLPPSIALTTQSITKLWSEDFLNSFDLVHQRMALPAAGNRPPKKPFRTSSASLKRVPGSNSWRPITPYPAVPPWTISSGFSQASSKSWRPGRTTLATSPSDSRRITISTTPKRLFLTCHSAPRTQSQTCRPRARECCAGQDR